MPSVLEATQRTNKRIAARDALEADGRALPGRSTGGALDEIIAGAGLSDFPVVSNEPSVLTSVSGRTSFDADVMPVVQGANAAVEQATNVRTNNQKSDASVVETEDAIPPDVQAELDAALDPVQKVQQELFASWERQAQDANRTTQELILAATKSARAQVSNLTGQWNERKKLLQESNRRSQATWKQQFFRTGQAEYSPGMTAEFLSQKEREGIAVLTELDNLYNAKIDEVNAALGEKKYQLAAQRTADLRALEEKALNQMLSNATEAKKVNDALREKEIQASRESAVSGLVQQGITDPSEIQGLLTEAAQSDGYAYGDFTLDEITDTLKLLGYDTSMAGLSSDYRTYSAMKQKGEINADWSYFDFKRAVTSAGRKTEGGGDTTSSVMPYDQFTNEFLTSPEGAQMIASLEDVDKTNYTPETLRAKLEPQLRELYNQAASELAANGTEYDRARVLLDQAGTDNWNELRSMLLERTDLTATEIDTLLRAKGISQDGGGSSTSGMSDEEFMEWLKGG